MKPAKGRWVTLGMLKKSGACRGGMREFAQMFGERVFVTEALAAVVPFPTWWLCTSHFMPPRATCAVSRRVNKLREGAGEATDALIRVAYAHAFIRWAGYKRL